jgi:hypothetical protein
VSTITSPRYVQPIEAAWFPLLEEAGVEGVCDRLVELGVSPGLAPRIAFFIRAHHNGVDDGLHRNSRGNYRRQLRDLGAVPAGKPPRRVRSIGGSIKRAALAA